MAADENYYKHLKKIKDIAGNDAKENVCLKQYTSFKVGGPADLMIFPPNMAAFKQVVKYLILNNINWLLIGNGTNMLVSDKGYRGVVVHTGKHLKSVRVDENFIYAQCGALLSSVASTALKNSLTGLEFASGIPGTVGGGLYMNAGAYGDSMKDVTVTTKVIDALGNDCEIAGSKHDFGYRTSFFKKNKGIILETKLKLNPGEYNSIKNKMKELNSKRKNSQPLEYPSGGSVFKRPKGYYAGKLIEDTGLKGVTIGGACVSKKHAGFIVNKKNATAKDINDLINHIIFEVDKSFGVKLEPEIIRIGEF